MAYRIKARVANGRLYVKLKVPFGATIADAEVDLFSNKFVRGLLTLRQTGARRIEYTGPMAISLEERLRTPISERDYYLIIEQIADASIMLRNNSLSWNNINWDMRAVFINEMTKEVRLMYLPIIDIEGNASVVQFIDRMTDYAKIQTDKVESSIYKFRRFLGSIGEFDPEAIEQFIAKEDPSIVATIKEYATGGSLFNSKPRMTSWDDDDDDDPSDEYEQPRESRAGNYTSGGASSWNNSGASNWNNNGAPSWNNSGASSWNNNGAPSWNNNGASARNNSGAQSWNNNGASARNNSGASSWNNNGASGSNWNQHPAGSFRQSDYTYVLDEEDSAATTLLVDDSRNESAAPIQRNRFPRLMRVSTGEIVNVDKPVFRIGKERSYVDYFVNNNNMVSRGHADIIVRANKCYVVDLNSTNRTFINDVPIEPQCESELHNGDTLTLGNEKFIVTL